MTPTQRTIAHYQNPQGSPRFVLGSVERWQKTSRFGTGIRRDLFGFIDFIGMADGQPILGIQSTGSGFSSHFKKITVDCAPLAKVWLSTGSNLELIGWRKLKGGWSPRIHRFTLEDFPK